MNWLKVHGEGVEEQLGARVRGCESLAAKGCCQAGRRSSRTSSRRLRLGGRL
jgi:hypothetical protein